MLLLWLLISQVFCYQPQAQYKFDRLLNSSQEFIQVANLFVFDGARDYHNILQHIGDDLGCDVVQFDQKPWFDWLRANHIEDCEAQENHGVCFGVSLAYIEWKATQSILKGHLSTAAFIDEITHTEPLHDLAHRICGVYQEDQRHYAIEIGGYSMQDLPCRILSNAPGHFSEDLALQRWHLGQHDRFNLIDLFDFYSSPALFLFKCVKEKGKYIHSIAILRTRTKFRAFDANGGIISCSTLESLLTGMDRYFLDNQEMWEKYSRKGYWDLELDRVYTKTGRQAPSQANCAKARKG